MKLISHTILIIAAILILAGSFLSVNNKAIAATSTSSARTLIIPNTMALTNPYIIIFNVNTGDMYHASTGVIDTTWGNCDIAGSQHASNKAVYTYSIPALPTNIDFGILIFDNAVPANTDAIKTAMYYDPPTGKFWSDTNPVERGRMRTLNY